MGPVLPPDRFVALDAGGSWTCALAPDGRAYCWGNIDHIGMQEPDTTRNSNRPIPVSGTLTFDSLSVGLAYSCALDSSGAAFCWGSNGFGGFGDGTWGARDNTPVAVVGSLRFSTIRAGGGHTCGIEERGSLYCWGWNAYGQLGVQAGETCLLGEPCATRPLPVSIGFAVTAVETGASHTCGLDDARAAYCWGRNDAGQLGNGSTETTATPRAVSGTETFHSLGAGSGHTCAATADGAAYCWGHNFHGEVGDGTTIDSSVPVEVDGDLHFAALALGAHHTCGLAIDGVVYCWGWNLSGQLGNGTREPSAVPLPVGGALRFTQVTSGDFYSCGIATDGVSYCWGSNHEGELGIGSWDPGSDVPARVALPIE